MRTNEAMIRTTNQGRRAPGLKSKLAKSGVLAATVMIGAISVSMAPASAAGCNVTAYRPTATTTAITGRSYRGDTCSGATTLKTTIRKSDGGPDSVVATASKTVVNGSVSAQTAFQSGRYRTRANTGTGVQVESSWVNF